jgi:hypothetical protein
MYVVINVILLLVVVVNGNSSGSRKNINSFIRALMMEAVRTSEPVFMSGFHRSCTLTD